MDQGGRRPRHLSRIRTALKNRLESLTAATIGRCSGDERRDRNQSAAGPRNELSNQIRKNCTEEPHRAIDDAREDRDHQPETENVIQLRPHKRIIDRTAPSERADRGM